VIRTFYEFHLDAGSGPMVNPFPLARHGRAHPHHNPMDPFRPERAGLYRPRLSRRLPRQIPDDMFTKVFAAPRSDRDRALVAFWVSSGARAAELLGSTAGDPDPARQVISVVRKGSRAIQELPACPDAFAYLALERQLSHHRDQLAGRGGRQRREGQAGVLASFRRDRGHGLAGGG
jgi:site-specific recombinase XerD